MKLWPAILDFTFPPRCAGCSRRGDWLCPDCRARVRPARQVGCRACGRRTSVTPCPLCDLGMDAPDSLRALVVLAGPVRSAVLRMKYGDRPQFSRVLAEVAPPALGPGIAVVPVPLHPRRWAARGYNQAELLARELTRRQGGEVIAGRLARRIDTPPQVGRAGSERRDALRDAFRWRGEAPPDSVTILDDVVTTGATLAECTRALRRAGAVEVHALAFALG